MQTMGRHALAAGVVLADTALLIAGPGRGLPLWAAPTYALITMLVIAAGTRAPVAALTAAVALAVLTGESYALLLWTAYQAGRRAQSRRAVLLAAGVAFGGLVAQAAVWSSRDEPRALSGVVSTYVVFVVLPLVTGQYLNQHRRLVSVLQQHNRQLRWRTQYLAEAERLRIARDMHDSLGHQLSLVSIQAAALEVSELPPQQRQAVGRLAAAARKAVDELHEVVGVLRDGQQQAGLSVGEAVAGLAQEFRAAGMRLTFRQRGEPQPLTPAAAEAAYRMAQEGLSNAARHASGQPVLVSLDWEPGALLLAVTNPGRERPPDAAAGGHGLAGLRERMAVAGGLLDHGWSQGQFRLCAMLPASAAGSGGTLGSGEYERAQVPFRRPVALGFSAAALVLIVLPALVLFGAR
jgi:signal transduction histidine kinase